MRGRRDNMETSLYVRQNNVLAPLISLFSVAVEHINRNYEPKKCDALLLPSIYKFIIVFLLHNY